MSSVFISYAQSDRQDAHRLYDSLRKVGVNVWLDREIDAGRTVSSLLRDAIAKSNAMIVLVTPSALESHWILFEIGAAEALNKKIIPVLLKGEQAEGQIPDVLKSVQWIDARESSSSEMAQRVKDAIASR